MKIFEIYFEFPAKTLIFNLREKFKLNTFMGTLGTLTPQEGVNFGGIFGYLVKYKNVSVWDQGGLGRK